MGTTFLTAPWGLTYDTGLLPRSRNKRDVGDRPEKLFASSVHALERSFGGALVNAFQPVANGPGGRDTA